MTTKFTAFLVVGALGGNSAMAIEQQNVIDHYADIAHAIYEDAELSARKLDKAIDKLIASPSEKTLNSARVAWIEARVPYQQSEVFRFGNTIVDDWEGQLNAWPLDEGLIDYVNQESYAYELGNPGATANIIANQTIQLGNEKLDISKITPQLLADLNEIGGSEANVATGYHAIEFLLWGQDLNGTNAGAGKRPYTDMVRGSGCTGGNCERRVTYLKAASELLVNDLVWMKQQWAPNTKNYRAEFTSQAPTDGLRAMMFGMGSLSLGELAGERMKVALEANSSEDEHDCFSDNTHNSHYFNQLGIKNIWFGSYTRIDGSEVAGPSLNDLVAAKNMETSKQISSVITATTDQVKTLVDSAEKKDKHFDQLIAAGNKEGHELVTASITALVKQAEAIEEASIVLDIYNLNPDTADHTFQ